MATLCPSLPCASPLPFSASFAIGLFLHDSYTTTARLSISTDDQVWTEVDFLSTELGVRQLQWDAKTGLYHPRALSPAPSR
jgi:hypothetical protein